jgi:hypothetical protein
MSHFQPVRTRVTDIEALKKAIEACGMRYTSNVHITNCAGALRDRPALLGVLCPDLISKGMDRGCRLGFEQGADAIFATYYVSDSEDASNQLEQILSRYAAIEVQQKAQSRTGLKGAIVNVSVQH